MDRKNARKNARPPKLAEKVKRWSLHGTVTGGKYLGEVEAVTKEEAIAKGLELPKAHVSFCHHCAPQCEDAELVIEATEVTDARYEFLGHCSICDARMTETGLAAVLFNTCGVPSSCRACVEKGEEKRRWDGACSACGKKFSVIGRLGYVYNEGENGKQARCAGCLEKNREGS